MSERKDDGRFVRYQVVERVVTHRFADAHVQMNVFCSWDTRDGKDCIKITKRFLICDRYGGRARSLEDLARAIPDCDGFGQNLHEDASHLFPEPVIELHPMKQSAMLESVRVAIEPVTLVYTAGRDAAWKLAPGQSLRAKKA